VAAVIACAALIASLPQPSWADRAGQGAGAAHAATTSQVTVRSLPGRLRLLRSTRLG
jgi:hypothetical protein